MRKSALSLLLLAISLSWQHRVDAVFANVEAATSTGRVIERIRVTIDTESQNGVYTVTRDAPSGNRLTWYLDEDCELTASNDNDVVFRQHGPHWGAESPITFNHFTVHCEEEDLPRYWVRFTVHRMICKVGKCLLKSNDLQVCMSQQLTCDTSWEMQATLSNLRTFHASHCRSFFRMPAADWPRQLTFRFG